jgi:dTDP-4-dehydrorhamnose 3,5-epimerase
MKFKKLSIEGQYLISHKVFKDGRGFFKRSFCLNELKKKKLKFNVKQGNISENFKKGTIRGFHYQKNRSDSKILTCINGSILNVTIDIRKRSKTFLKITKNILNSKNKNSILVPGGCANLFLTLNNNTIIHYYMNEFYNSKKDMGFRFNDKFFNLKWPITPKIISKKDKSFLDFKI